MCIALPMQVQRTEPGHAVCEGRGETRRVRTALVGEVSPGDWLLVFLDSAQERLRAEQAREIDATLDLLAAAMRGLSAPAEAAFDLPSRWSTEQLQAWSGQVPPSPPSPPATEASP